jgi:hypothetical protein
VSTKPEWHKDPQTQVKSSVTTCPETRIRQDTQTFASTHICTELSHDNVPFFHARFSLRVQPEMAKLFSPWALSLRHKVFNTNAQALPCIRTGILQIPSLTKILTTSTRSEVQNSQQFLLLCHILEQNPRIIMTVNLELKNLTRSRHNHTKRDGRLACLAYYQHAIDAISLSLMAFRSPHWQIHPGPLFYESCKWFALE